MGEERAEGVEAFFRSDRGQDGGGEAVIKFRGGGSDAPNELRGEAFRVVAGWFGGGVAGGEFGPAKRVEARHREFVGEEPVSA